MQIERLFYHHSVQIASPITALNPAFFGHFLQF